MKKLFLMAGFLYLVTITAGEREQIIQSAKAQLIQKFNKRKKPKNKYERVADFGRSKHKEREKIFNSLRNIDHQDLDADDFEVVEMLSAGEELEQRIIELQQKQQLTIMENFELRCLKMLLYAQNEHRNAIVDLQIEIMNTMPVLQLHEIVEAQSYLQQLSDLLNIL